MVTTKNKRPWWKWLLVVLGWVAAAAVVFALFGDGNGNLPIYVYAAIGILALNHATSSLMDRLDAILWKLEDIERRLPAPDYDSYP